MVEDMGLANVGSIIKRGYRYRDGHGTDQGVGTNLSTNRKHDLFCYFLPLYEY